MIFEKNINQIEENFHKAINDDMNMPLAMSYVWELIKYPKKNKKIAELLLKFDTVLAIKIDKKPENRIQEEIPEEIQKLAEERKIAKQNKNWEKADKIREEIKQKG